MICPRCKSTEILAKGQKSTLTLTCRRCGEKWRPQPAPTPKRPDEIIRTISALESICSHYEHVTGCTRTTRELAWRVKYFTKKLVDQVNAWHASMGAD